MSGLVERRFVSDVSPIHPPAVRGVTRMRPGAQYVNRIVVVGASLAGLRAAEGIRAEGYQGEVVVIGDEQLYPYDRPPLSKEILAGEMTEVDICLHRDAELDVIWRLGTPAVHLDPERRVIELEGGEEIEYDGVVLATGSRARDLPVFDPSKTVHTIRSLDDSLALKSVLGPGVRLLIVGCGFIGIEVASSARELGVDTTVMGIDAPLAQAGPLASAACTALAESNGVTLHTGNGISGAEVLADGAHRVTLTDGTVLEVDQVVIAVGSVPNIDWLARSGLPIDDGILCDSALRVVGHPDIVAAGDIARWTHQLFDASLRIEHWSNAVEQGKAAARSLLLGDGAEPFAGIPSFWSDHFGIRLQAVGCLLLADRYEIVQGDVESGRFAAAAYAGDDFVGGIAYGMPRAMAAFRVKLAKAGSEIAQATA